MQIDEIYCDADGVLTDFDGHAHTLFGQRPDAFPSKSKFWTAVTLHERNGGLFFRELPKTTDADVLMAYLVGNFPVVKILTACGHTPPTAKEQKIAWFAEHYPNVECIVVTKSPDKAAYAHSKAVLIDDRSKSIDPWVSAGGIGVLHRNAENTIAQIEGILRRAA